MASRMTHLNGNLLCCVDTETTGLIPGFHDIIQVCVLPLDSQLQQLTELNGKPLQPFVTYLQPKRPENADARALQVNKLDINWLMNHGIEPFRAADMFEEWWTNLQMAIGKKIVPLGANAPFDRGWMIDWLGDESYYQFFDYHYRDIQVAAQFINDRADFQNQKIPFPFVKVTALATYLNVPHEHAHDALQDCLIEAEIYRQMCLKY